MKNKTPQLEDGFIQIATGKEQNDVFMALIKQRLNGTQYQIILLTIRKTWGYKKKDDWISLTQFENYLSKSRWSICKEIKKLVNNNILVKFSIPGVSATYSINKEFNTWKILVNKSRLVNKTHPTSQQNAPQLVNKSRPTKETITKETITKEKTITDKSVYSKCSDIYNNFCLEKTSCSGVFNAMQGKALKEIIGYLSKNVKTQPATDDSICDAFRLIFNHYDRWDKFNQGQLKLNQINSNLINILNNIKNGNNSKNNSLDTAIRNLQDSGII